MFALRPGTAVAAAALLAVGGTAGVPATSADARPTLVARALLPADATAPGPDGPQPVGGFSALLDAAGEDTFWAMPDNGFGSKAKSRDFPLRVYRVQADFETARGGPGKVDILDWVALHDPDAHVPFPIGTDDTEDRLLTGGDFDIESMRVAHDGTLWFGDEYGPFLLHTDASGRLLEAPFPLPGVESPDNPAQTLPEPNLARSNGFEAMAVSADGRMLYPVLEGPVAGDEATVRRMYAFDVSSRTYVGRLPDYRVDAEGLLVSDAAFLDSRRLVVLERDNLEGEAARHKRAYVVRLAEGLLSKRQVADLLDIHDPDGISLPARPGDVGLGERFAMPYETIEAVLPLHGGDLAVVNDTNFGSRGRNPGRPDPSDFVVIRVPGLRDPG